MTLKNKIDMTADSMIFSALADIQHENPGSWIPFSRLREAFPAEDHVEKLLLFIAKRLNDQTLETQEFGSKLYVRFTFSL